MNRRIVGIALAVLLGVVGTFVLARYVQSARDDAAEPEPTATVLVVSGDIPQGASLDDVAGHVESAEVPERLVADGALDDLDGLDPELVIGVALQPGEQLLRSRLVEPSELVSVDVPAGLQELTIALDPERAVGGQIEAGATVGIVISYEPFELAASGTPTSESSDPNEPIALVAPEVAIPTKTPNTTHLTLNQVLVTSVQLSRNDAERSTETRTADEDNGDEPAIAADISEAPGDRLLVTMAVTAPEAEQIVFAAEFGSLWLTGQDARTDSSNSRILTLQQAYVGVPR
jgi:pilus assembly protein CpaB